MLAAVQFTHVVDFMIMMPLGPQFMRLFGIDPRQFGFLVSAYTFAAAASGFVAAFRIDRADRKRALLALYAGFIVATALCGLAPGYATLLAARVVAGAFGGVLGALVLAIVADLVPYARRAGATAIVAVGVLARVGDGRSRRRCGSPRRFSWRAPFLALAATSVAVAVLAIAGSSRDALASRAGGAVASAPLGQLHAIFGVAQPPPRVRADDRADVRRLHRHAVHRRRTTSPTSASPKPTCAIIYFAGGLATLVTAQVIGWLADRYGKQRVFTIVALAVGRAAPGHDAPAAAAARRRWSPRRCCSSCSCPGASGPAMALVTGSVEPRLRGSFMSFNASIQQLGSGLASLVAGLIIGRAADGSLTHYRLGRLARRRLTLLAIVLARRIRIVAMPRKRRGRAAGRRAAASHPRFWPDRRGEQAYHRRSLRSDAPAVRDTPPHDHPVAARHRPLQVHDDAGRAASVPGGAGRVPVQVPQRRTSTSSPVRRRDRGRDPRAVRAALHAATSSTTCGAGASSRATSSTCSGLFQLDERFITVDAAPGLAARDRHHDQGAVAAHDPVRGAGARDRHRGLLPQHACRRRTSPRAAARLAAKIAQINAVADPEFRIADYGTRRRFSRVWQEEVVRTLKRRHRREVRRHQQRQARARRSA